jgi:hypothetical protein
MLKIWTQFALRFKKHTFTYDGMISKSRVSTILMNYYNQGKNYNQAKDMLRTWRRFGFYLTLLHISLSKQSGSAGILYQNII